MRNAHMRGGFFAATCVSGSPEHGCSATKKATKEHSVSETNQDRAVQNAPDGKGAACCGCKTFSSAAQAKFAELDAFIDSLGLNLEDERRRGRLIQILHRAQHIFGYLPR
jgi:hypothetical protein